MTLGCSTFSVCPDEVIPFELTGIDPHSSRDADRCVRILYQANAKIIPNTMTPPTTPPTTAPTTTPDDLFVVLAGFCVLDVLAVDVP